MPGVGKSTLGRKLALTLAWKFVDLDQLIEIETGKSISNIFEENGESYFRELEENTLKQNLPAGNLIVACGGGTPVYHNNISWMKSKGYVIYLEASSKFIFSRVNQPDSKRPMFKDLKENDLLNAIEQLLEKRSIIYEQAHEKIKMPLKSIEMLKEMVQTIDSNQEKNEEKR